MDSEADMELRESVMVLLSHFEELEEAVVGLHKVLYRRGHFLVGNHACEDIDAR